MNILGPDWCFQYSAESLYELTKFDRKIRILALEVRNRRVPIRIVLLIMHHVDFEASLLRLVEKITNGTVIEISYTGKPNAACKLRICFKPP